MDLGESFWIIFCCLFVIFIQWPVAKKFEKIAEMKGYDEEIHSFAMCFWLGWIGYLYVIALPDLHTRPQITKTTSNIAIPLTDMDQIQQYECPQCKTLIAYGTEKCPNCQQVFDWKK